MPPSTHPFYSARYFPKSPTWFAWNRLSASDIHCLTTIPGFEGQNVYFHLNHPIRFVKVTGVVVGVESIGVHGRFTLISIDDGSGKGIVGKVVKRDEKVVGEGEGNTEVEGVDVGVEMGLPAVWIGGRRRVEVGTVLSVKGTLEVFRGEKQIVVKRVGVVEGTMEEVREWEEVVRWRRDVLGTPWALSEEARREVDLSVEEEARRARGKAKQKRDSRRKGQERKRLHDEKKRLHELKKEAKRERHEKDYNKGALKGSERIPAPWD